MNETRHAGRRPTALFIAFTFPPAGSPGSPRTWNIATRLQQCGWDVTVVTVDEAQLSNPDPSVESALRSPTPGLRVMRVRHPVPSIGLGPLKAGRNTHPFLARAGRRLGQMVGLEKDSLWTSRVERLCAASFKPGEIDVVLVSAPPFGAITAAKNIAARLQCPFVLDYRDLWTLNAFAGDRGRSKREKLEGAANAGASAITVVGPACGAAIERHFGTAAKMHVITNGYDGSLLGEINPTKFDHFAMLYAGSFYLPKLTIDPVMKALGIIEKKASIARDWKFHYYGPQRDHVVNAAREAGLPDHRVVCHGVVPRMEALSAVAGADLVTVITNVDAEASLPDMGVITGKIFEAIGLGRQMLVITPPGSDAAVVAETAGRSRVVSGPEVERIAGAIEEAAAGVVVPPRSPESFDWANLGPRFSDVLSGVVRQAVSSTDRS